jgi:hypothetical protein
MNLQEAINAVESAVTTLGSSDAEKAAAQAKFEAAQTTLNAATATNAEATKSFNSALDGLIAAATAAKR